MGYGDVDAAFAGAPHVFEDTFWMHRGSGMPMETRAVAAQHDPFGGTLTVWSATQTPHLGQRILADLLDRDIDKVRMIAPDVGGGFGLKAPFYPEEAVIPAAAILLGRPVKWSEDRRENFLASAQERDQYWTLGVAVDASARSSACAAPCSRNSGAFMPWGMVMPPSPRPRCPALRGPELPARDDGRRQQQAADRAGARRGPSAGGVRNRAAAGSCRARTQDRPGRSPPTQLRPTGADAVFRRHHHRQRQAVGLSRRRLPAWPGRCDQGRGLRRLPGSGSRRRARRDATSASAFANYVEGTGLGPYEGATVRILQNGKVTVATGATTQGQGTRTMMAQVVADRLGCRMDDVIVTIGDTGAIPMGVGAFASRQAIAAGSAAHTASLAVRKKVVALAARALGVAEDDIDVEDGRAIARGGNKPSMSFSELARMAQGMPGVSFAEGEVAGLEQTEYFYPPQSSFCNGTHICEAEVDPMTGGVTLVRYTIAHDSGTLINPMIVDGQVHGGTAHGIGNALFEWMKFDAEADPLTTTFQDYLTARAPEVPMFKIVHIETPNPLEPDRRQGRGRRRRDPLARRDRVGDRGRAVAVRRAFQRNAADAGEDRVCVARGERIPDADGRLATHGLFLSPLPSDTAAPASKPAKSVGRTDIGWVQSISARGSPASRTPHYSPGAAGSPTTSRCRVR